MKRAVEPRTGYTLGHTGPERCSNCTHFEKTQSECNGPKMKELSMRPRGKDGDVKVSAAGYCKFWSPSDAA
jgi:hypothetical protein